ncbi:MAG: hypothetical protein COU71_01815 [Parcubacteria group bacterium CG10_big_fil_rev_8_21_14_0_10_38_31]|nr:MAG: hypothetical protein COU71_01815 [Parcubacteria group bacterium CG10_big_fil_rev_8_21_14_0_10_38_31]
MNFELNNLSGVSPEEKKDKEEIISNTCDSIIYQIQDKTSEIYKEDADIEGKKRKLGEEILKIIKKETSPSQWYPSKVKSLMEELNRTNLYDGYNMGAKEELGKAIEKITAEYEGYENQI